MDQEAYDKADRYVRNRLVDMVRFYQDSGIIADRSTSGQIIRYVEKVIAESKENNAA